MIEFSHIKCHHGFNTKLQGKHEKSNPPPPPVTCIDISAVHADFLHEILQLNKKMYTLSPVMRM